MTLALLMTVVKVSISTVEMDWPAEERRLTRASRSSWREESSSSWRRASLLRCLTPHNTASASCCISCSCYNNAIDKDKFYDL